MLRDEECITVSLPPGTKYRSQVAAVLTGDLRDMAVQKLVKGGIRLYQRQQPKRPEHPDAGHYDSLFTEGSSPEEPPAELWEDLPDEEGQTSD